MNSNEFKFKSDNTFEKRKEESKRILEKYPERIPVIVEKQKKSKIADIEKTKYLVPRNLTVGQFNFMIRNKIKLTQEQALVLFCNNILPLQSAEMSTIYKQHVDQDGFLYISYCGENTFGA